MRAAGTDAVGALRWGLRRYRWLVLACLVLGAVVAPRAEARFETPVEAESLVIAQVLDMDLVALPRYGEAVFDNGAVAEAVAARFPDIDEFDDIVPNRISLVAEQDSIVFRVVGRDVDPQIAADLANTATEAFLPALNATGVGAGLFALQSPATPPAVEEDRLGSLIAIPIGLVAGLFLALTLVSLFLIVRRPIIAAEDAEEATGVPVLGTVKVPRTRRGVYAPPEEFPGLVPVCRRLLHLSTSTLVLVSQRRDRRARAQLTAALAKVLVRVRDVRLIGPTVPELNGVRSIGTFELEEMVAELEVAAGAPPSDSNGARGTGRARITIVDSSEPLDLVQPPRLTATVLVFREGIRSAALQAAVVEHLGGSAEARLLLVKKGRWSRARPKPHVEVTEDVDPREAAMLADKS
ncbi:hypothetical protein FHU33_4568 [Blastococcus colisei]|uniref:Capsular polysaccharide biosynthesis protein n=1 Tax=Blastococcus colisei TaxID=1564162 RepID=A0A543P199_9ACTN|nr:hypothetical protein [Blastococcus colisei]TQN37895.1 hypothetical protein FHU33_4568 [Blastococcus colisei]